MKILAIDSSAEVCSAAIIDGEKLIGEFYLNIGFTHSQTLMPVIDCLLKTARTDIKEIDRLAVTVGPGSFTGLRIGIATVKGLALVNDVPCVGISTLDALAYNARFSDGIICPVMDARCFQIYNALYRAENGRLSKIADDRAIKIDDLHEELKKFDGEKIYLVGDGSKVAYNEKYLVFSENSALQRASAVAFLAQKKHPEELISGSLLSPVYLRLPQAERELREKTLKSVGG